MITIGPETGLEETLTEITNNNNVAKITTIYLEKGTYKCNTNIVFPITIVGTSREHCIIAGGLNMNADKVNVSNLTIQNSLKHGVYVRGGSVKLDNVSVENSVYVGVYVYSTQLSTMNNCNISGSYGSGLCMTGGGTMTIKGKKTTIQNNCRDGSIDDYGLDCLTSNSSIHITGTIEKICKNGNGGGGNYGGSGTFAIVNRQGQIVKDVSRNLNAVKRGRTKTSGKTSGKTSRVIDLSPIQIRKDSPRSNVQVKQQKEEKEEEDRVYTKEQQVVDDLMKYIEEALLEQAVELNNELIRWYEDPHRNSPNLEDKIDTFSLNFETTIKKCMRFKKYKDYFGIPSKLEQIRSNGKAIQNELKKSFETEKVQLLKQKQKELRKAKKLAQKKRFKKRFEQQQRKEQKKRNKVGRSFRLRMW